MNNDNRNSSHNHHDYDDMDKLKHEHGITDEHGDNKDKHQEHHAGHDHSEHSGHDHSGHNGHDHSEHNGHDHSEHSGHDHSGHNGHDHSGHSGHDHSGHGGHAHHHHGSFKELFLKSLPLGIIIMFFSPLHGFKLPFQFTFPYSDIVVAILSTILIVYGGRPFYQGAVDEFKQKNLE